MYFSNNDISSARSTSAAVATMITVMLLLLCLLFASRKTLTDQHQADGGLHTGGTDTPSSDLPLPNSGTTVTASIPSIEIGIDSNGKAVRMPLVGAGTGGGRYNSSLAYQALCKAFAAGYTLVDTAYIYGDEVGVGNAIRDCFTGKRSDLFVLTKIPGGLARDEVLAAHKQNLMELQLDYVDHLMTHFPADWHVSPERSSPARRQEEWLALEEIYYAGEARSIGVSHYCPQHIDDILQVSTVNPSINQVEYHVGSGDVDHVMDKCKQHNITFMSFSPLCGPCSYDPIDSLISGKLVTTIGERHNVTGAQVSLRFIVQQALQDEGSSYIGAVIPESNNPVHIRTNMDLFRFELSDEEMKELKSATKPGAKNRDCGVP